MPFFTINQSGGDVSADGDHLLFKRDKNASGSFNIRMSGAFGGATVQYGYLDRSDTLFTPHTGPDLTELAPIGAPLSLVGDVGIFPNFAVRVAGISGTTDIQLELSSLS